MPPAIESIRNANGQAAPMRIGIIGAGVMGTCLAGLLDEVATVMLVCRNGERAAQIIQDGVRVRGLVERDANPIVVRTIDDLARLDNVSAIFVATKTSAISSVAADLKPVLDRLGHPCIVSFQNGIDPGRQLIELLGDDRVLRMVLNFGATMNRATSVAEVTLNHPPHRIGYLNEEYRSCADHLAAVVTQGGFETVVDERIDIAVWRKGIVNAAVNPVCALVNSTVGEVLDSPSRLIVERLLDEGIAVAQAAGIDLGKNYREQVWSLLAEASDHTPSMVEDIRSGHESEVGQLNRQIIEYAREFGIDVPTHEVIDAMIETFDFRAYQRG